MALMSEERRKEMEEEMNRFELEIAAPDESKSPPHNVSVKNDKPLSPPPAPPVVKTLIPDVLIKAPPPPPPPLSPPITTVLRPPPPPPAIQNQSHAAPIRFIPHQVHRQPPKPPTRPSFMAMAPSPGAFPPPGPFGPHMAQGPPMGSMPPMGPPVMSMPPGPHMHGHMHPMPPGIMPMSMHHQMASMGMNLPMPPGFCPPSGLAMQFQRENEEQQYFNANNESQNDEADVADTPSTGENSSVLAAAPAIYAAPFVKTHSEQESSNVSSESGQETQPVTTVSNISYSSFQKTIKINAGKTEESSVGPTTHTSTSNEENVVNKKKEKKKKIVRMAGGQAWEDNSLLDWESDDFRIFCGDLGNDVTDEVLIRAFSKYPSFVKAKVIRDKRTNKTKGYGFVSFKDPQDFIKAMREMNGRYVGSRPIKLRKSSWRDRNIDIVKKKQKEKEKLGLL